MLLLLLKLVESQREQQLLSFQSKTTELPIIIIKKKIKKKKEKKKNIKVFRVASQFWSKYCTVPLYHLYNLFCQTTCQGMFYTANLPAESIVFWILD